MIFLIFNNYRSKTFGLRSAFTYVQYFNHILLQSDIYINQTQSN